MRFKRDGAFDEIRVSIKHTTKMFIGADRKSIVLLLGVLLGQATVKRRFCSSQTVQLNFHFLDWVKDLVVA